MRRSATSCGSMGPTRRGPIRQKSVLDISRTKQSANPANRSSAWPRDALPSAAPAPTIRGMAMEHRLAAVLAADMVGYSRLMELDERGTLARLRTHRIELIDPAIAKNQGRIIKTTGDGMLVEFQSVADAVRCAAEVQSRMRRRNSDLPDDRRMEFGIGINLGDII